MHYSQLFDGTRLSNCSKPCLSTKVSKILNKLYVLFQLLKLKVSGSLIQRTDFPRTTVFVITINQDVQITEYFYPSFSFSKFLSDFGGCVGLWLGLGTLQIATHAMEILTATKNKLLM